MSDRPIGLNLGMPSNAFDTASGQAGTGKRREGDAADAQHLRSLLSGGKEAAEPSAATPKPFDLFHSAPAAAAAPSAGVAHDAAGLDGALSQMAQRLLVDDGGNGRRAVQIQLNDASLPGVVMDVSEDEGAVVAVFTCSSEASRERLARAVQWLADGLAGRLQRDVRVKVLADDPEDPCPVEAFAGANAASAMAR